MLCYEEEFEIEVRRLELFGCTMANLFVVMCMSLH